MKRILYILIAIVVILAIFFLLTKKTAAPVAADRSGEESSKIEYVCDQGEVDLVLSGEDLIDAKIIINNNMSDVMPTHNMKRVVSASGTRYATADENIVFWSKGTSAFITENGETTYENCNEK
jgi:membrane-bound inhibitor of C-type lysozyme